MGWQRRDIEVAGAAPIRAMRLDAPAPGPVLAVLGGVHGDEPEGALAADALTRREPDLARGALIVVPVAHPAAQEAGTRCCPAGGNLARVFPGDAEGPPVSRVAAALKAAVLDAADALVDLHTAGRAADMPFLAGYAEAGAAETDAGSRGMAAAFGADAVWRHPGPAAPGRTLSVMQARGKPAIYVEAPGGGGLDETMLGRYGAGLDAVMAQLGLTAGPAPRPAGAIHVTGPGDIDNDTGQASCAGHFAPSLAAGDPASRGQPIGRIHRPGADPLPVRAPGSGVVMYLRRASKVEAGTPLVAVAAIKDAQ